MRNLGSRARVQSLDRIPAPSRLFSEFVPQASDAVVRGRACLGGQGLHAPGLPGVSRALTDHGSCLVAPQPATAVPLSRLHTWRVGTSSPPPAVGHGLRSRQDGGPDGAGGACVCSDGWFSEGMDSGSGVPVLSCCPAPVLTPSCRRLAAGMCRNLLGETAHSSPSG